MEDAAAALERLWGFRRRAPAVPEDVALPEIMERFQAFMDDDFDTAGALSVLFELVREGNSRLDAGEAVDPLVGAYDDIVGVLGLEEPEAGLDDLVEELGELAKRFQVAPSDDPVATVERLLDERANARAGKDWARSDEIRDGLAGLGIHVEDAAGGTRWHR